MGWRARQGLLPWEELSTPTAPGLGLALAQSGVHHRPASPALIPCLAAQRSPES